MLHVMHARVLVACRFRLLEPSVRIHKNSSNRMLTTCEPTELITAHIVVALERVVSTQHPRY